MTSPPPAIRRAVLTSEQVLTLQGWCAEIETWPAGSHVSGQYAEQTPGGPTICRTENVSACHLGVAELVEGSLRELAAAVRGEPVSAFKDKVNYKQPGGAGFRPHQDLLAYPGVDVVISVLVAIDECTRESGCLWIADGVEELLATDDRGVVQDEIVKTLDWSPAELAPGDAVCIDGFAPHYSEANDSDRSRRVLVASYAPSSEGYSRSQYYAARRAAMTDASARDGRSRISTLADFDGTEISMGATATDQCTHD